MLKPAANSFRGYGGVLRAPDGALWTFAGSAKKDTGPHRTAVAADDGVGRFTDPGGFGWEHGTPTP